MATLISTNPGRGYQKIGSVQVSTKTEIQQKVHKARKALPAWRELSLAARIKHLQAVAKVYKQYSKLMAETISQEMGKPIIQSLEDVHFDLENIASKIKLAREYLKPQLLDKSSTQENWLYKEPLGVIAAISPWNYPSSNFFISTLQSLLAGNTIVFKHSEETPLVEKLLERVFKEAHFPTGVMNFVYGDGKVGSTLTDMQIDGIHFTGSTKVGQLLYRKAAEKFIPALLEMGGSSPGIIFEDADLALTCPHACGERFFNAGQICCALKRLIVHQSRFDEVVADMKKHVEAMKIGDPLDPKTQIGPLVAKRQLVLLEEQVADAVKKGAKIVTGGKRAIGLKGAYYLPTILTQVKPSMRVMKEEVFGPVLPIVTFKNESEAVAIANKTDYGLSAYIYTQNKERATRVASRLEAGQVSVNGASYFSEHSPFGGYKLSGMGRNDGVQGFDAVTQKKVVARPINART